jgi:hypothetical protein
MGDYESSPKFFVCQLLGSNSRERSPGNKQALASQQGAPSPAAILLAFNSPTLNSISCFLRSAFASRDVRIKRRASVEEPSVPQRGSEISNFEALSPIASAFEAVAAEPAFDA